MFVFFIADCSIECNVCHLLITFKKKRKSGLEYFSEKVLNTHASSFSKSISHIFTFFNAHNPGEICQFFIADIVAIDY